MNLLIPLAEHVAVAVLCAARDLRAEGEPPAPGVLASWRRSVPSATGKSFTR